MTSREKQVYRVVSSDELVIKYPDRTKAQSKTFFNCSFTSRDVIECLKTKVWGHRDQSQPFTLTEIWSTLKKFEEKGIIELFQEEGSEQKRWRKVKCA